MRFTFRELLKELESFSDDELNQQVTIETDGENTPLLLRNEGQTNVYFAYDHDADLDKFFQPTGDK